MQIRTSVRAGGISWNHNERLVGSGLKVRSGVRAGGISWNHNERLVGSGLKVRTHIKAGGMRKAGGDGGDNHNERLLRSRAD
jgi:hypothetical protein